MARDLEIESTEYDYGNFIADDEPVRKTEVITLAASQGALAQGNIIFHAPGAASWAKLTDTIVSDIIAAADTAITTNASGGYPRTAVVMDTVADSGSTQKVLVYTQGSFNEDTVFAAHDAGSTAQEKLDLRDVLKASNVYLKKVL